MIKTNKGFTLIELIITIAIAAVIASIAVPSFRNMILENRLTAFSNDFVNSIALARNEALSRRAAVSIVPNGGDWGAGWTVVSGGVELGSVAALEQLTASNAPPTIVMTSKGVLSGLSWAGLKVCDSRSKCRAISLTGAGVVKVTKS